MCRYQSTLTVRLNPFLAGTLLIVLASLGLFPSEAADKKIVLIAGKPSHGPGDHEFRAGCLLLKQCLDQVPGIVTQVYSNGWPHTADAFQDVNAVFIYADGGGGHPAFQEDHEKTLQALAEKGVGLGFAHYAVEVPGDSRGKRMQEWLGGYYEHQFSVNPMWSPHFERFPSHPVARGVNPFTLLDEWYFNMRWAAETNDLTHLLVATPSNDVRDGPYVHPKGPYPHIVAASGRPETMMWLFERNDGGRAFGFTGGHKHVNWADDNYRRVVLNALLWIAKAEIPEDGVQSEIKPLDITKNLDPKGDSTDTPNITGSWKFDVQTEAGSGDPSFHFYHAGQNLLAQYVGRFGKMNAFGFVKGKDVTFWLAPIIDGQELKITYSGRINEPSEMSGTVRFGDRGEGRWSATRVSGSVR